MGETTLRPRSISEILDATFSLLRRDYVGFVTVMAVVSAPMLILMGIWQERLVGAMAGFDGSGGAGDIAAATGLSPLLFVIPAVVWVILYPLIDAAVILAASDLYMGKKIDVADVLRRWAAAIPSILFSSLIKGVAVMVGMLFLVFPGVYIALRFSLVPGLVVLEGVGTADAFSRSEKLTHRHLLRILGALLLVFIMYNTLALVVAAPLALFNSQVLTIVAGSVTTILLYPVLPVTIAVLYYDLRIRKEGFDIEVMSQRLEVSAEAPAS